MLQAPGWVKFCERSKMRSSKALSGTMKKRWPGSASGMGHNQKGHMSRVLQLGNAEVDYIALAELCRRYQVRELSVFGSAARGEMRPDSDIDLLVEFQPDAGIDLVDHAG